MYKISELKLPLDFDKENLAQYLSSKLKLNEKYFFNIKLIKLSIDARDKSDINYKASIVFDTKHRLNVKKYKNIDIFYRDGGAELKWNTKRSIVVVGSGPSGLFAAYRLALSGAKVTILERGYEMSKRQNAVNNFMKNGILDTVSNIQFGEGGAGTFSDGKLNTGIKSNHINFILETFHKFGADEKILYDAKPHIGTEVLSSVIVNMREYLKAKGVEFLFEHRFVGFKNLESSINVSVVAPDGEKLMSCDYLVLAIGHSSRDTIRMLYDSKVDIKQKAFAMGYRIEHLQKDINTSQFGNNYNPSLLPPADYKFVEHVGDRVVYSFCMCPGGVVVPATSSEGMLVTNGMSYNSRAGDNANAAILVNVNITDFPSEHPLAGIEMQEMYENLAYLKSGGFKAVVQKVEDFLEGKETKSIGMVIPSYRPGYVLGRVDDMLPDFIVQSIKEALPRIAKKIEAFNCGDAILTGIETRSSAPYQIVRDRDMQTNHNNVYAIGEGAGFAGGIISSAAEGIKCADILIAKNNWQILWFELA